MATDQASKPVQARHGCHEGAVYQDFDGDPDLPGLCAPLPLHLCCHEENNGATEASRDPSSPAVPVSFTEVSP